MEAMKPTTTPLKLGFKLKPVQLVLLYKCEQKGLRKRLMPIRRLTLTTDPRAKAEEMRSRHLLYLEKVPIHVTTKLVAIVQEISLKVPLMEAVDRIQKKFTIDATTDLNLVSNTELQIQKDLMQMSFQANSINKNHPNYVYDKEVDFDKPTVDSAWDEDDGIL